MWRRLLQLSTIIILYLILQDGSIVQAETAAIRARELDPDNSDSDDDLLDADDVFRSLRGG
jgi:hypothetical protein